MLINAYLRDLEALQTLDDLAAKGNHRAYVVTDASFAETLKWDTGSSLSWFDLALRAYRRGDVGYVGTLNEANSNAEAKRKRRQELNRILHEDNGRTDWEIALDESKKEIVDVALERLGSAQRKTATAREGTFSPIKSTYDRKFLGPGPLTDFTDSVLKLYQEVEGNDMLRGASYRVGDQLSSLGEETFKVFLQAASDIARSELLASGNMAGKDQKQFFNSVRGVYNKLRGSDPERAKVLLSEVLLPFLYTTTRGRSPLEATSEEFRRGRVDLPDLLPDAAELFLEDILNVESAETLLAGFEERARLAALAKNVRSQRGMTVDLDWAAMKQDLGHKISAISRDLGYQSVYDMAGNAADGRSVRLQADGQKSGDLTVIFRIPGQDDIKRVVEGVISAGQKFDRTVETDEQFVQWMRAPN
jgi:hypothetical protein